MTDVNVGMLDMRNSYITLVRDILRFGVTVEVRGETTYEFIDATLSFAVPYRPMLPLGIGRSINTKLAAVEALALIAGSAERDLTMAAAPSYGKVLVSQSEKDFYYAAYGPRVGETIETVVQQLARDNSTRQAVLTIWRRDDLFHDGDKPCTLTIQFMIRHNQLHMIVNMRSNDVWLGLAYDAFVFNQLHWTVLKQLKKHHIPELQLGTYRHHAASLHLYARDVEKVHKLGRPTTERDVASLPLGVECPTGFFPDQVAERLLHPNADRPTDMRNIAELNPWYNEQMVDIERSQEAIS